jgi:nucleotide-binding universal stress UspA family protein
VTGPLIVGYSGSSESCDAVTLTRQLAPALDAPVVALSVVSAAPLEVDVRTFPDDLREEGVRLQREVQVALSGLDEVEVMAVTAPSPARALVRFGEERGASMIVIGSTHRGTIGRVVPGTVADRLFAGSPCAVAIAPRGLSTADVALQTIGVGFDGSPEALAALSVAAEVAQACGASIDLIAVVNPQTPIVPVWAAEGFAGLAVEARMTHEQVDWMWEAARTAIRRSVPEDSSATVHVIEGMPADVLLERSGQLDLLVLGSRGYGPFARALTGSVSSEVARRAACPLIVTPRPDEAATQDASAELEAVAAQ